MKAEIPSATPAHTPSASGSATPISTAGPSMGSTTPDNASSLVAGDEDNDTSTLAQSGTTGGSVRGKDKSPPSSPVDNSKKKPEPTEPESANLVGKINNLITTDLGNITDARDFIFVRTSFHPPHSLSRAKSLINSNSIAVVKAPLQIALSIWFLNSILGWSAFVGLLVMVILFPVPIWLGSVIQRVQIGRMKKVCWLLIYF